MRIGHLAQELGIRPSRIRYYEEAGLLAPPARISGRRHYGQETVDRLRLVLAAQQAGFTLAEIRELVSLLRANNPVNQGWSQLATAKAGRDYLATIERPACFGLRDRLHLCWGCCGLQACQRIFTPVDRVGR